MIVDQLGITVWRLRTPQAPLVKPAPKFVILAEADKADKVLLNNILKALNCDQQEVEMHWVDEPASLKTQTWPKAPMIVFGEALHQQVPKTAIKTLSLTALNTDLAAKKALWAQLKTL